MTTLVRIKRPLTDEPAESIVVKPKRQRIDGVGKEWIEEEQDAILSTSILQRVATVSHKDENLQSDILRHIQNHKTGKSIWKACKKPNVRNLFDREANRQYAQARASQSRQKLHARSRGCIESGVCGEESKGAGEEGKIVQPVPTEDKAEKLSSMESDDIKYYDAEFPWPEDKDVVTCNGIPLESEKYVYDIYYSPQAVDWTKFVCEVERYDSLSSGSSDELPDDEDEEDDENHYKNDYPEEEEDVSNEDEEDCMARMIRCRRKQYDTDESFDADEYDDDADFDENGSLLLYGETSAFTSLHLQLSRMKMDSEDKITRSEAGSDNDSEASEYM